MPKEKKEKEDIKTKKAEAVEEISEEIATEEVAEEEVQAQEASGEKEEEILPETPVLEEKMPEFETVAQEVDFDKAVTVKPVKFASFEDLSQAQGESNKNLDILMDIKLQLTVELGRTELPIKKVLELTRGSIIELEKVAGEPVELYANGKLVAHGEVVVIEDNFGLRITSITEPEERLKGM